MLKASSSSCAPPWPHFVTSQTHDIPRQYHILAFEGPDPYARAGGIASRISGLAYVLAESGFETHLWFVGDPDLPGYEIHQQLHLHRWCQWISRYHPAGVYDTEKRYTWLQIIQQHLLPRLRLLAMRHTPPTAMGA